VLDFSLKPLSELLSQDPEIVRGELHFTDTRVPLSTVLDNIAAGESVEGILDNYPSLSRQQVMAVLNWKAGKAS